MRNKEEKISIIGAGSWGTALALLLAKKGYSCSLWGYNKGHLREIAEKRENGRYLPGIKLPENLKVTDSLEECVKNSSLVVMVVPSHGLREVFKALIPYLAKDVKIISAVKGIENDTLLTMTGVMKELLQKKGRGDIETGVLSGPSFAREVADGVPTAVTIGFPRLQTARDIQKIFGTETFRVYAGRDVTGLEISGSFKNIIAIAAGVCDGLKYGLNTRAALITRGLAEMKRLGVAMKADPATFSGLSGIGDLLLTCTGDLSRNRTVGLKLGQGKKLQQITGEMSMVAEGIKTTASIHDLAAKLGMEMPILEQVYNLLYKDKSCSLAVEDLLTRELGVE
ncbi:MAG: NAD(P)-dependent glycerol-3-phosphate dehydrogenase [Deltaproteobacteria bacterium]|nr:NAD(P)-dependent glycerol-3-phosphate dehydrogenase [Deltaproteobacteria bacterium]MBW2658425.1 NAD(P)-dependent glycerol-3-phosphate dehydrogenase [Deltaproteobacteria bacterium]